MIVERSACCVEEATFSGRWLSSKPGHTLPPLPKVGAPGCAGRPAPMREGARWAGRGLGAWLPATVPQERAPSGHCPSGTFVHLCARRGKAVRAPGGLGPVPLGGVGPAPCLRAGVQVCGRTTGVGWRSPRSRLFPACAPSKGSALCSLTSPVPSRRRFHQSPSGQDLRAGEAERRLHAAEADDGEESCARAPGSSRPPLLTGELRGPVGAASRGVPGGCAVLTAPPWPLP